MTLHTQPPTAPPHPFVTCASASGACRGVARCSPSHRRCRNTSGSSGRKCCAGCSTTCGNGPVARGHRRRPARWPGHLHCHRRLPTHPREHTAAGLRRGDDLRHRRGGRRACDDDRRRQRDAQRLQAPGRHVGRSAAPTHPLHDPRAPRPPLRRAVLPLLLRPARNSTSPSTARGNTSAPRPALRHFLPRIDGADARRRPDRFPRDVGPV